MDQILNLIVSFFKSGTGLCFFILLVLSWAYYGVLYKNIESTYEKLKKTFKETDKKVYQSKDDYKNIQDKENENEEEKSIKKIIKEFIKSSEMGTENVNTEVIIQKCLDYKLNQREKVAKLLPSVSIALGLLGTFIGLVFTIADTQGLLSGGGISDYSQFASSMSGPFKSMSIAFFTSILGVAGSTILNYLNVKLENKKEEFYDLIEDYLDNVIYSVHAKNFVSEFNEFNTVIKNSMTQLASDMRDLFDRGVQELVQKINRNTNDLTDMVIAMNDSTKDLNRLSASLNNTVENFRKPVEAFKISMDDFINTSESTSQSMRDSVNKFGVNVVNLEDKLSQMNKILDINKTKMENIAVSINDSSEIMKKSYDNAEETMNNISKNQINSMEEFRKQLEGFKNTSKELNESLNNFTEGFKTTQEATSKNIAKIIKNELSDIKCEIIKNVDESLQDVEKSVSELNEKTNIVSEQTKASTDFFEGVNNQLKNNKVLDDIVRREISEKFSNELNNNFDQMNIRLNDYMKYIQQKIDESLNKLDNPVEKTKANLDNSVNELNESAKCIKEETSKMNKFIENNANINGNKDK